MNWKQFVLKHGLNASVRDLAFLLSIKEHQINYLRQGQCRKDIPRASFGALFSLWHGREPKDGEWPAPVRSGLGYDWQPPELALLASLTGRMPTPRIAELLTQRLRLLTGDPTAERNVSAVIHKHQVTGVLAGDLLGGLTVSEAAREVNSIQLVHEAIRSEAVTAKRIGHRVVIPRDQWDKWKTSRIFPPAGYIRLRVISSKLGVTDGVLTSHARNGLIPTAKLCNPYGTRQAMSKNGVWYLDGSVARMLVKDRRAGNPMPWHGVGIDSNLKVTWSKLQQRRHPSDCHACAAIWGDQGPPTTFDDYCTRFPNLKFQQKRHLTQKFRPGVTVTEAARISGSTRARVEIALETRKLKRADRRRPVRIERESLASWHPEPKRPRLRRSPGIPRLDRNLTYEAAATRLGKTRSWIAAQVRSGLVHPVRDAKDCRRRRLSPLMLGKLETVAGRAGRSQPSRSEPAWVRIHDAASLAGVTAGTIVTWHDRGLVPRRGSRRYFEYHRESVRRAAREYWHHPRLKRSLPPTWIAAATP